MLSNSYAHDPQGANPQDLDADKSWNPLDYGVEIVTRREVQGFLDAIPEPPAVTEARWNIIEAYESGAIGAVEALYALEANGCLTDADDFLCSFIAGTKARLNLGETPSVSPDVAPGLAESLPSYSPQPELLNVLAGVRALASGGEA